VAQPATLASRATALPDRRGWGAAVAARRALREPDRAEQAALAGTERRAPAARQALVGRPASVAGLAPLELAERRALLAGLAPLELAERRALLAERVPVARRAPVAVVVSERVA